MDTKDEHSPRPPLTIAVIGSLHLRILRECDKIFRQQDFPVKMDQVPVLLMLYYSRGLSQQEICFNLQRDKASVNRTVSFFGRRNYAKIIQDAKDRRKTRVELTAAGKKLAKQADAVIREFDATLTAGLTESEIQQFASVIKKMIYATTLSENTKSC